MSFLTTERESFLSIFYWSIWSPKNHFWIAIGVIFVSVHSDWTLNPGPVIGYQVGVLY